MKLRSLRARVLLGSLLWALGLLAVAHMTSMLLLVHFPRMRGADHFLMVAFALVFIGAGLWHMRRGLAPFEQLRERLAAVRAGQAPRLEGSYPVEVQPLVNDLNALLDHRERVVRRALGKAGDLAHGLKTPLAVLFQEAERAGAAGHAELAAAIREQAEKMRGQMDYHLAQARAAASGATPGAHCPVLDSVAGLVRTLQRLHAERGLAFETQVPPALAVRCEREDLDEMLGNLLDNACKWARSRVAVAARADGADLVIVVDDDGPGLDPSLRDAVLQRGVRADEAAPGSGFGLAIVRDLAELYGGAIELVESPLGGARARLRLPNR